MSFGKSNTSGNNNNTPSSATTQVDREAQSMQWNTYNVAPYDLIDATEETNARGNKEKRFTVPANLNFMMTLGFIPKPDGAFATKVELPIEGEEYSAGELAHMAKFSDNYYYTNEDGARIQGKKEYPEEQLALAFDIPSIQVDANLHPRAVFEEGETDFKPLRVSYNGFFAPKKVFNTLIRNSKEYKTGKMNDKNPMVLIAKAAGLLEEYEQSGYNYGVLANAKVNLDILAVKNEYNGRISIEYKVNNPTAIEDVKFKGKVLETKEEQLAELDAVPPFVGIEQDDAEFVYAKEDLVQIRQEYFHYLAKGEHYTKTGKRADDSEWTFSQGVNWLDSTLYKACVENEIYMPREALGNGGQRQTPPQQAPKASVAGDKPLDKQTPVKEDKAPQQAATDSTKVVNTPDEEFDEFSDVPF